MSDLSELARNISPDVLAANPELFGEMPSASADPKPARTQASEHEEQVALFNWARWNTTSIPELNLLYAVPNGGHRHRAVAAKMKAEGVKAGYPDIGLDVPRLRPDGVVYHGLRIELKTKRGRVSEAQEWWIDALNKQGYHAVVCRGADEAIAKLEWYLGLGEPSKCNGGHSALCAGCKVVVSGKGTEWECP